MMCNCAFWIKLLLAVPPLMDLRHPQGYDKKVCTFEGYCNWGREGEWTDTKSQSWCSKTDPWTLYQQVSIFSSSLKHFLPPFPKLKPSSNSLFFIDIQTNISLSGLHFNLSFRRLEEGCRDAYLQAAFIQSVHYSSKILLFIRPNLYARGQRSARGPQSFLGSSLVFLSNLISDVTLEVLFLFGFPVCIILCGVVLFWLSFGSSPQS